MKTRQNNIKLSSEPVQQLPTVVVIGAGVAGIGAALDLAEKGHRVILCDKGKVVSGSSGKTPGRMGLGFHYVDIETAEAYLRASISVQRKFPGFRIGEDLPWDHPIRHGRYLIREDSDYPPEKILETYGKLQKIYEKLIEEDPANEVFGPSKNFFRILDLKEYEKDVDTSKIVMGIETPEHLLDWPRFADFLRKKILSIENITVYEDTEVIKIERGKNEGNRFIVHTNAKQAESKLFFTDYIVNSSWQNVDVLNDQVGLRMIPGSRTNRLKALVEIELPPSLQNIPSMFFCMGQHCMFSNMGNGHGMITYAKETNIECSDGLDISKQAKNLLNGTVSQEEKDYRAQQILKGVSGYIPEIIKAKVVDIKFGIVQTEGTVHLTDPESDFHKRNYYGVKEEQIGLISNRGVKLFYFLKNGYLTVNLLAAQLIATSFIKDCMRSIEESLLKSKHYLHSEIKETILLNQEMYTSSDELQSLTEEEKIKKQKSSSYSIYKTIEAKAMLNKEIEQERVQLKREKQTERFRINSISEPALPGQEMLPQGTEARLSISSTPQMVKKYTENFPLSEGRISFLAKKNILLEEEKPNESKERRKLGNCASCVML